MSNWNSWLKMIPCAIPAMVLVHAATSKLLAAEGNALLWGLAWIELAVAVGLIVLPRQSVPVALSLFWGFIGFLLVLWFIGEKTCNCIGIGRGNIFWALTIDPLMISLLLLPASERLCRRAYLLCGGMALAGAVLAPKLAEYALIASYSGGVHVHDAIVGDVYASSEHQHQVTVTNRTSKVLEVDSILPTCNCTTVDQEPFSLTPGESRDIQFQVDLFRYFPEGETIYRSRLTAGFYDSSGELIGTPTIFSGRIQRNVEFSQSSNRLYSSQADSSVAITAKPLHTVARGAQVHARLHKPNLFSVTASGTTAELSVNKPIQPFETSHVTVAFGGREQMRSAQTFEISVLAEPPELELDWQDDSREFKLAVKGDAVLKSANAKWVVGNAEDQQLSTQVDGNTLNVTLPKEFAQGVVKLHVRVDSVDWTYFFPPMHAGGFDRAQQH